MALRFYSSALIVAVLSATIAQQALAAKSSDQLLPATTKGLLSVPDVDLLQKEFDTTQFGQLLKDPLMEPFVADFKRQLQENGNRRMEKMGLTLSDLDKLPTGEVAMAVIQPAANQGAVVLIANVAGNEEAAKKVLDKVSANLKKTGGRQVRRVAGDVI
ncbi:MAG: hypothetical protein SGJ20_09635, partial [Planctomycetota bacterium]|nr:hypothetical protein [Planctomycetota bacterium]